MTTVRDHPVSAVDRDTLRVDTRGARLRRDRRRAVTLLLLTLVVPGAAQLTAGSRRLGALALRTWLCGLGVLLAVGVLWMLAPETTLSLLTRASSLVVIQVLLLLLAAGWFVLLVDAWRLGRPDRLPVRDRRRLLGLLVVMLLVPALVAWAGMMTGSARAAMTSVFGTGEAAGAVDGRYNVLLLGGDSGSGRTGLRPDSIQLVSVDAETGAPVVLGFSRETEHIRFNEGSVMAGLMPEGWMCGDECLLNGIYTWALDHADEFPADVEEPGVLATTEAVEWLTGLSIQYYAMADLKGFRTLVDAVGGLDITVQRRTPIGNQRLVTGYIEPGRQHLDGATALWYARSRADSTNYERMARQRCVLSALVAELDPATVLLNFGEIAASAKGIVETDIPQDALASLATVAVKTKEQKIRGVNFVPPLMTPHDYDVEEVRATVARTIAASEEAAAPSTPTPTPAADDTDAAPATPKASKGAATPAPEPTGQAVMQAPGADPNAETTDLASICSS